MLFAVDIQDAEANVDDGFGGKSRYGGGADVIHPHGPDPESIQDFFTLYRELRGPCRVWRYHLDFALLHPADQLDGF